MTDKAVVFVGPTLGTSRPADERLVYFGPAGRGDIYRVAREGPRLIALVDGTFENGPSIFHKEILWAISKGIHVFGSSSLGALRAAELHPFGMSGFGEVFSAFRDGTVERDDAVAVLHGPGELGWTLFTEALVDIDLTLRLAAASGIISQSQRSILLSTAGKVFWKTRTYEKIIAESCLPLALEPLSQDSAAWISKNRASQKALDAQALIRHILDDWDRFEEPFVPAFELEQSLSWEAARYEIELEACGIAADQLAELDGRMARHGLFSQVERQALANVLASELFDRAIDLEAASSVFRKSRGLESDEDLIGWLRSRRLRRSDYFDLATNEYRLAEMKKRRPTAMTLAKLLVLRELGLLEKLISREES